MSLGVLFLGICYLMSGQLLEWDRFVLFSISGILTAICSEGLGLAVGSAFSVTVSIEQINYLTSFRLICKLVKTNQDTAHTCWVGKKLPHVGRQLRFLKLVIVVSKVVVRYLVQIYIALDKSWIHHIHSVIINKYHYLDFFLNCFRMAPS